MAAERGLVARMKKSPEPKVGFTLDKLEKYIEEGHIALSRGGDDKKKTTFAPSSIGFGHATCDRYWHIAFTGAYFDDTADSVGIAMMMTGSASHERIQSALEKTGIVVETEREMKWDSPPIRGYADLILEIDGEKVVAEIKTTGPDAFLYRQATSKPAVYHLYQILIYMMIEEVDKGVLLYENRGTLQILPIMVKMNEKNRKILEDALGWMRSVHSHWESGGEIPKRPWTRRNKACKTCPVFDTCWDIDAPMGEPATGPMPEVKL